MIEWWRMMIMRACRRAVLSLRTCLRARLLESASTVWCIPSTVSRWDSNKDLSQNFNNQCHISFWNTRFTFSRTIFQTVFISGTLIFLTYFDVMCEQHHRNSFLPFLNAMKNVTCKPGLDVNCSVDLQIVNSTNGRSVSKRAFAYAF